MSKGLQWTLGIGIVLIVLAVIFSVIWPFVAPGLGWSGYGLGPMMPGYMAGRMGMGGGFFGFGMLLGPLFFVGLTVLGVVWLVRATTGPNAAVKCAHCGRPLQAGWKACPSCGEKI